MKKSQLRPIGKKVAVLPDEAEKVSKGGILIPDNSVEKLNRGTIIAIGKALDLEQYPIKVGQRIVYGQYAGHEVKVDKMFVILDAEQILAEIVS